MTLSDNTRGILFMNIAMASFTINDMFMKIASSDLPLSEMIAIRGAVTVVLLLLLAKALRVSNWRPIAQDRKPLFWRSFAEVCGTATFLIALRHMPLANLSAILQALPLAVTLSAALLMGEKVGWRRLTAIAIGFCGVLMIVRPGTDGFNQWSLLALVSVGFVVVRDLSTRQFSRGLPTVVIALYSAVAVTVMGMFGLGLETWQPVAADTALTLCAAALMLVLGYLFIVMATRQGDIALIAPFRYSALIWAIFLGWLSFGDLPGFWTSLGAAVIVATGLFTYLREYQLQQTKLD